MERNSFDIVGYGRKTALVRADWRDELAWAMLINEGCAPAGKSGRGEVLRFEFSAGTALIRPCRRGGIAQRFIKDAYLITNRPLRELKVHMYLYEQGFAAPEPFGVCWERAGILFRGAIATREVEDAQNLLEYLSGAPIGPEYTIERAGRIIREMHDLGVFHADLQVRNILIAPAHPFIIDFDKAKRLRHVSHLQRTRNLLRLRRSFDKNYIPRRLFDPILKGYGIKGLPSLMEMVYDTKGALSDALAKRGDSDEE